VSYYVIINGVPVNASSVSTGAMWIPPQPPPPASSADDERRCSRCAVRQADTPERRLLEHKMTKALHCKRCAILFIEHQRAEDERTAEMERRQQAILARQRWEWIDTAFRSVPPHLRASLYRNLSRTLHPDAGGDEQAMQALNAAKERYP